MSKIIIVKGISEKKTKASLPFLRCILKRESRGGSSTYLLEAGCLERSLKEINKHFPT
jgi:hypothetical protein